MAATDEVRNMAPTDTAQQTAKAAEKTATDAQETVNDATETAEGAANGASTKATEATSAAKQGLGGMVVSAFTDAARDILQPAIQQMGEQAAQQAVNYAKEQGPKLMREQVLPKVMEATGAEQPGDVVKQG